MMRFVVNENIPGAVVRALREVGHDVLSVKEVMRGQDDRTILSRAQTENRIVVTQDKDFGELAYRYGLIPDSGIILFRLSGAGVEARRAAHVRCPDEPRRLGWPLCGCFG